MSEDLSKNLKDLAIEKANDVIVATILKPDATILESIQEVSKPLHKELANDEEPNRDMESAGELCVSKGKDRLYFSFD